MERRKSATARPGLLSRPVVAGLQLDDKNKIASGPIDKLSSYAFFGREIYSVADGAVVAMADDRPEQVPGKLPEGIPLQMALGNYVVVDIGEGRHGVSLLCWRSGGLEHPHDTPPYPFTPSPTFAHSSLMSRRKH